MVEGTNNGREVMGLNPEVLGFSLFSISSVLNSGPSWSCNRTNFSIKICLASQLEVNQAYCAQNVLIMIQGIRPVVKPKPLIHEVEGLNPRVLGSGSFILSLLCFIIKVSLIRSTKVLPHLNL